MVDDSGVLVDHVEFDRFGNAAVSTPANSGVSFGLDGMRWEPLTGLYQTEADP